MDNELIQVLDHAMQQIAVNGIETVEIYPENEFSGTTMAAASRYIRSRGFAVAYGTHPDVPPDAQWAKTVIIITATDAVLASLLSENPALRDFRTGSTH